jgi:hypothetical protein
MTSPFQSLLGAAFGQLPAPVRHLHSLSHAVTTSGLAEVRADRGLGPWLICRLAGLPKPGRDVPVTVSFRPDGRGAERWQREFATRHYASTMRVDAVGKEPLLGERFGPFDLYFCLTPSARGLAWSLVGWRLLGLRLPDWTLPRLECFESSEGERFVFDIDAAFPIVGHVVHYRGWLVPQ